jgi:hypothetical protein
MGWASGFPGGSSSKLQDRLAWLGGQGASGARDTGLALTISEFKRRDTVWSTDPCSPADVRRSVCDYFRKLTGISNRRAFLQEGEEHFARQVPEGRLVHARLGPKLAVEAWPR